MKISLVAESGWESSRQVEGTRCIIGQACWFSAVRERTAFAVGTADAVSSVGVLDSGFIVLNEELSEYILIVRIRTLG